VEPSEDFDRVYARYARRCAESAIDPLGYSDAWSVVRALLEALRADVTAGEGDRAA